MDRRRHPLVTASLLWLTLSPLALAQVVGPQAGDEPHALIISGGVSLGAYEAGLNWALLESMKLSRARGEIERGERLRPNLTAVTGASAGSINAVLSAMSWCTEGRATIDDNALWHTWLDLDIDGLMPVEAKGYEADDGLLSRRPMQRAIDRLICMLDGRVFESSADRAGAGVCTQDPIDLREGCEVRIGLMVSRVEPAMQTVAGLEVPSQRFVVPMRLVVEDKKFIFRQALSDTAAADPLLGNVALLPEYSRPTPTGTRVGALPTQAVIDVVKASSAFPVAFGPRRLEYCVRDTDHNQSSRRRVELAGGLTCSPGWALQSSTFIDGGVFDNVPLGAARVLAEHALTPLDASATTLRQRVHYLYIDPDRRRHGGGSSGASPMARAAGQPPIAGLETQARFVGGFIDTARNYELQAVLRFGGWNDSLARIVGRIPIGNCQDVRDALNARGDGALREHLAPGSCQPREATRDADLVLLAEALTLPDESASDGTRQTALMLAVRARDLWQRRAQVRRPSQPNPLAENQRAIDAALGVLLEPDSILDARARQRLTALRYDRFADRALTLSDRNGPLVGSLLGAFGAFFDRTFREHDYLAGVYDAVFNIARHECSLPRSPVDTRDPIDCIGQEMEAISQQLGLVTARRWMLIARRLGRNDLVHLTRRSASKTMVRSGKPDRDSWTWLTHPAGSAVPADDEPPEDLPAAQAELAGLESLMEALYKDTPCRGVEPASGRRDCFADLDFGQFAERLRPHIGPGGIELSSALARDAFEADDPIGPLLVRAMPRLQAVEALAHPADDASRLPKALAAATWLTHTVFDWPALAHAGDRSVWRSTGSTLPADAAGPWHLVPDWIAFELTRSGGEVGWDPQLRYRDYALRLGLAAGVRTRPASDQGRAERRLCDQQAGRLLDAGDDAAAADLEGRCSRKYREWGLAALPQFAFRIPRAYPYIGFIGLGGSAEAVAVFPDEIAGLDLPQRHPFAFGASATLGLLGDKIRLTWRKRLWLVGPAGDDVPGWTDGWIGAVQFNDLPGLAWWLSR